MKSSLPDFLKDPYGDPFVSEEMRDFASNLGDSDNENDENIDEADEEEIEQIKSALEEEDGSGKIFSQTIQKHAQQAQIFFVKLNYTCISRVLKKNLVKYLHRNNSISQNFLFPLISR